MIDSTNTAQSSALAPLTYAWLGLVLLTLFGLGVGQWFRGVGWQPLLVAAIVHGGKLLIPGGHSIISEGDRVIVVAKSLFLKDLNDILVR